MVGPEELKGKVRLYRGPHEGVGGGAVSATPPAGDPYPTLFPPSVITILAVCWHMYWAPLPRSMGHGPYTRFSASLYQACNNIQSKYPREEIRRCIDRPRLIVLLVLLAGSVIFFRLEDGSPYSPKKKMGLLGSWISSYKICIGQWVW